MSEALVTNCTTPRARNSYPNVFKPQKNKLSGKDEYSVQALFEKPLSDVEFKQLKTCAENACINKWGADRSKWPKNLKLPFKTQDELIAKAKEKNQAFDHFKPGAVYLTFKTSAVDKTGAARPHPTVVGKNPKEEITESSKFYAGCWAKFNVTAAAFSQGANHGVSFYLNACQFVGDAPAFGNRPSPETAFEAIPEEETESEDGGQGDATDMFN